MAKNPFFRSIQAVRERFNQRLDGLSIQEQAESGEAIQLDTVWRMIRKTSAIKVLHPLFIENYRRPSMKYAEHPVKCIGLDVETDATTGEPKLLGIYYPAPLDKYRPVFNPTLETLFNIIDGIANNSGGQQIAVWGSLDIQVLIRLFDPTEKERKRISRGISANVKDGQFIGDPPCKRPMNGATFYISHYIQGRSLKLGILSDKGYESTVWVFNFSQFFPGTIATTAKALQLDWYDYDKNTHIVDWDRYFSDTPYRALVHASNKQDAATVQRLSEILQEQFHATFDAYPTLLVSTGSLTDAAVSKMLSKEDYASNSWDWLKYNVWKDNWESVLRTEVLLSEAFSAGYVDQFAVGYFPYVYTADIAAAYPHKIRALPDLRYSEIITGSEWENLEPLLNRYDVETVIFRGIVFIPPTLKYHPITVKTYYRENYRPQGIFYAAYTLEERQYCLERGAQFSEEDWSAIIIHERYPAPIALVSERLGEMRNDVLRRYKESTDPNERAFLAGAKGDSGQQYVVKVIDNSIYGKTVMTTERIENIAGEPQITGYIAGDRFNLLYGTIITARTRVQLATACHAIEANGGRPIMTMTDSLYWEGEREMLPNELIRHEKTPGYFESPTQISHFYILKTGQYEYRDVKPDEKGFYWRYKLRGLPIVWESLTGKSSFYRHLIQTQCKPGMAAKNVKISVNTRRLISIGSYDLAKLGKVEEGWTTLQPFVLSSKQSIHYLQNWYDAVNGHIWLDIPQVKKRDSAAANYPLFFLRETYEDVIQEYTVEAEEREHNRSRRTVKHVKDQKRLYIWSAMNATRMAPPAGRAINLPWKKLEDHFGIPRNLILQKGELQ